MRQIVLDTETTGLAVAEGHRLIEIAGIELINRRFTGKQYHQYICPEREIDAGALAIHGITQEFLADKPLFSQVATEIIAFIQGAELIIHNAPFDVGFLNNELQRANADFKCVADYCSIFDTLAYARKKHPGQHNSLDALCKRYGVNNSARQLHGALLDADLLARVYLAMTGGQVSLFDETTTATVHRTATLTADVSHRATNLKIISPDTEELNAHYANLAVIRKMSDGNCLWDQEVIK